MLTTVRGESLASAPAMRIASLEAEANHMGREALPQRPLRGLRRDNYFVVVFQVALCLSARCADCVGKNAQIMTQYVVHNAVSR